jgi:hypothetical protein
LGQWFVFESYKTGIATCYEGWFLVKISLEFGVKTVDMWNDELIFFLG